MFKLLRPERLVIAIAATSVALLTIAPLAAAQTAAALIVRVETPAAGQTLAGTITFTGLAIDGSTIEAARRVAVYDAEVRQANYLADVSMETVRPFADAIPGRAGVGQIGWRLILDSNRLTDGRHTLQFVASFPSGASAQASFDLVVNNRPREPYRYAYDDGTTAWRYLPYQRAPYDNGYYSLDRTYYSGYYPAPYYATSYYQSPYYYGYYRPTAYSTYPGGYYYNGVFYPAGSVTYDPGWYYLNGVWFRR